MQTGNDMEDYILPFITPEQYKDLITTDQRLRERDPHKYKLLQDDVEYRFLNGCKVCGWKGIKHANTKAD